MNSTKYIQGDSNCVVNCITRSRLTEIIVDSCVQIPGKIT